MKRFALVTIGTLLFLSCSHQEPNPEGLKDHIGKDLRTLDERAVKQFRKEVEVLTGDKSRWNQRQAFEPWWVKPFAGDNAAWLLLEAYPGYEIPDVSAVQLHLFDENWKRIAKQAFPIGYRFFLNDVALVSDNPLRQDLLVAKATSSGPFIVQEDQKRPLFEQGDYQRQFYGLLGDRFVMVRLEDDEGKLARSHYRWHAPAKGPPVPKHSRDEWIRSLRSTDLIEQLAALVWLSGLHLSSTEERRADATQESVEDSRLFEAVRDAAETRTILGELANSKNAWVREYAEFTLQVLYD